MKIEVNASDYELSNKGFYCRILSRIQTDTKRNNVVQYWLILSIAETFYIHYVMIFWILVGKKANYRSMNFGILWIYLALISLPSSRGNPSNKATTTLEPFIGNNKEKQNEFEGKGEQSQLNVSSIGNNTFFYFLLNVISKTDFRKENNISAENETSVSNATAPQGIPMSLLDRNVSNLINYLIMQHVIDTISWNTTNSTLDVKPNETDETPQEVKQTPSSLLHAILEVLNNTIRPSTTTATTTTEHHFHINEIKKLVDAMNTSTAELSTVNNITSQIQALVETKPRSLHRVTQVLTQLSEVTSTDSNTVQMYSTIFTKIIEVENNHTDNPKQGMQKVSFRHVHSRQKIPKLKIWRKVIVDPLCSRGIFPDLMLSMENVVSSALPSEPIRVSTPEIEVSTTVFHSDQNSDEHVVIQTVVGTVYMPVLLFDGELTRISTIAYRSVHKTVQVVKGYHHARIGSNVMSVSLQRLHNTTSTKLKVNRDEVITMILPTDVNGKEKSRLCTFWNFEDGFWDTAGSVLVEKNGTHTKCQYSHLTNFAVLVLYHEGIQLTEHEEHVLTILTTVGCSLSIACLGVTLITYLYLRVLSNEKMLIHANLSVSMILAQFVLVTSQDAEDNTAACKVVAILLHFLFMASFTWMMVEGLVLYLACTRGLYNYGDMRIKYFLLGWGLPAVIVVISVGTQFPHYGPTTDDSCWLSAKDGLIWAFMGPMLAIIMFNIFILGLVIRVFLRLKANSRKSDSARFRASVKTVVTLLPLLGTTWLLGLFVPFHAVFHFLFAIGNSMQGMMIFVLHCICNEEVRKRLSEKRHQFTSNGVSASDTDISNFRPGHPRRFLDFRELSVQHFPQQFEEKEDCTQL